MKCRNCKREIPDNSVFCNWCGERQIREKKKEITVPKPTRRKSGLWIAQIMIDGKRTTVSAATEADYYAKARALKSGIIESAIPVPRKTLDAVVKEYIASRALRSPSTVLGYESTWKHRFLAYHDKQLGSIDFQRMVNEEAKLCSAKTLSNAWGLVRPALKMAGYPVSVTLGKVPKASRPYLTSEQLSAFLEAVRGRSCELAALLALHSLRLSELTALQWEDISDGFIHVHSAVVRGKEGMTEKDTTKSKRSDRYIKIFIPRLRELLDAVPADERTGRVCTFSTGKSSRNIKDICIKADLPPVTMHGLRHTFATLCHRLNIPILEARAMGGWEDLNVLQEIYTHLDELDAQTANTALESFYYQITTSNPENH